MLQGYSGLSGLRGATALCQFGNYADDAQNTHACSVYPLLNLNLSPQQVLDNLSTGDISRPVDGRDIECREERVGVTHRQH
jgi:hypothetical protein